MPHVTKEYPLQFRAPGMPIVQPAKINQLYADTALIWDTPLFSAAAPVTPSMFWITADSVSGFAPAMSRVDGGQLAEPSGTELRFRGPGTDRFITSTNPLRHPFGPIYWPSDAFLQQTSAVLPSYNADVGNIIITLMIGGPRYRHTGLGCNVLFADGSVRTLYLKPFRKVADGPVGTGSADYVDSDFRRHMLMIKWPPGFTDTHTIPTNSTRP
jgi:prepilin-type processing-associated H-X9-DG protein